MAQPGLEQPEQLDLKAQLGLMVLQALQGQLGKLAAGQLGPRVLLALKAPPELRALPGGLSGQLEQPARPGLLEPRELPARRGGQSEQPVNKAPPALER